MDRVAQFRSTSRDDLANEPSAPSVHLSSCLPDFWSFFSSKNTDEGLCKKRVKPLSGEGFLVFSKVKSSVVVPEVAEEIVRQEAYDSGDSSLVLDVEE